MPRDARLDIPGVLYHVIGRGIERGAIFGDGRDYTDFLRRLGGLLPAHGSACYAWSLLPNHFHLLLRRGDKPLSRLMQRLLTGYASFYNRRKKRSGHLFQNRYRATICQEDAYFLELVRYIHLNPLRAGLVESFGGLAKYRWCGHGAVLGVRRCEWQDREEVLSRFGNRAGEAVEKYGVFVQAGVERGRRTDLDGGGVVRSAGGMVEYVAGRRGDKPWGGDDRILGSSEFVRDVLRRAEAHERRSRTLARKWTPRQVVGRAAEVVGLPASAMYGKDNRAARVAAKDLACKWLVEDLGMRVSAAAKLLGMSPSCVSRGVARGREAEASRGVTLK